MAAEYNGTTMTGGDSLTEDLNIYYEVSATRAKVTLEAEQY